MSGEQRLEWRLWQREDPRNKGYSYGLSIDALTGEVTWAWIRSNGIPWPARKGTAPPRPILLYKADGYPAALADTAGAIYLDGDVLWTRLESLALYGAPFTEEEDGLRVHVGNRALTPEQLGGELRPYGWYAHLKQPMEVRHWWVPVKQAA